METEPVHERDFGELTESSLAQTISITDSDHGLIEAMLSEQAQRESTTGVEFSAGLVAVVTEQSGGPSVPSIETQLPVLPVESAVVSTVVESPLDQPGPLTTQAETELNPAVLEVESTSMGPTTQAGGSSICPVAPSVLYDTIKALIADEDPEKAVISAELVGFTFLLNNVIDKVLNKGSSFSPMKRLLDRHVAIIREEGFPDLADSISDNLIQLEQELVEFKRLRSDGASVYISSRVESIIQAKEAKRKAAQEELRQVQVQADQIRTSLIVRDDTNADLLRSIETYHLEIDRLKKALNDTEEACAILQMDLASSEKTRAKLAEQLKALDERSVELDQKVIQLLTLDDASRALLEKELTQKYQEELSSLEERIRQRQLSV